MCTGSFFLDDMALSKDFFTTTKYGREEVASGNERSKELADIFGKVFFPIPDIQNR